MKSIFTVPRPKYRQARNEFRNKASKAGATLRSYPITYARGQFGEKLFVDVAVWGRNDATKVLVVDAGMHGVEAYGALIGLLAYMRVIRRFGIPQDMRIIFIFPLNPHGTSWLRRVNGHFVDLSRNFLNFALQKGRRFCHLHYDELNDLINPKEIRGLSWLTQRLGMGAFIIKQNMREALRRMKQGDLRGIFSREILMFWSEYSYGWRCLKRAISMGQYKYPKGMQYGGSCEEPENIVLRTIIRTLIPKTVKFLAWVNGHIGLGEWGKPLIITEFGRADPMFEQCVSWYGKVARIESSHDIYAFSTASPDMGAIEHAVTEEVLEIAPNCEITAFCLEVGTYPLWNLGWATHADGWLHQYGNPFSKVGKKIKKEMAEYFYPDDPTWRRKCRKAYLRIIGCSVHGLSEAT